MAQVYATDVDPACLALARENAAHITRQIEWIESDWYRELPAALQFDLIVSNPPYIAAEHPFLEQGDLPAEPQLALTPGTTGLEALQQIIEGAHNTWSAEDILYWSTVMTSRHPWPIARAQGFTEIRCEYDLNDLPRTSIAKRVDNPNSGA